MNLFSSGLTAALGMSLGAVSDDFGYGAMAFMARELASTHVRSTSRVRAEGVRGPPRVGWSALRQRTTGFVFRPGLSATANARATDDRSRLSRVWATATES